MNTIRVKLILLFSMFMIILVCIGILLNGLFLKRYYVFKNRSILLKANQQISREFKDNPNNITEFINTIDRSEAIKCTITDKNLVPIFNSFPKQQGPESKRLPGEIEQLIQNNKEILADRYIYSLVNQPKEKPVQPPQLKPFPNQPSPTKDGELALLSQLDSGEMIILTKSMKGITESASIANQFFIFAGLIIILFGGICIFLFSKRVVKPIILMSHVAEDISNLDFSKRAEYASEDELGRLAISINHISEKLSKSLDILKQDVERRKQLVRNISHELKTPIGVIKGYTEGLKFGVVEDKDKIQHYYEIISSECDRMDSLVQELLNLSLLESGMFQLKITHFDLNALVQKIAHRFDSEIMKNRILLKLTLHEELMISADYDLMERLISNFVTNALHHVGGKKEIHLSTVQAGSNVRVTVYNSGTPIPKEDLNNIWDVFYKVDKARSREYGGHGLGLYIVELITALHNGVKGVENRKDGVLFYVEIPMFHEGNE